jgi:hypothetical protein
MNCIKFLKLSIISSCKSFGFRDLQLWLIYWATACMSRKWQILVLVLWFTLPCLCIEVWLICLRVLGLVLCNLMRLVSWLMCLSSSMWCLSEVKLISSRCLCELWVCLYDYLVYCTSMHSYICIVAPYLGTLAEAREGPDVELTWRWCWWIHPEDGRIEQVLVWEMLAKRVSSDKL